MRGSQVLGPRQSDKSEAIADKPTAFSSSSQHSLLSGHPFRVFPRSRPVTRRSSKPPPSRTGAARSPQQRRVRSRALAVLALKTRSRAAFPSISALPRRCGSPQHSRSPRRHVATCPPSGSHATASFLHRRLPTSSSNPTPPLNLNATTPPMFRFARCVRKRSRKSAEPTRGADPQRPG